MFYLCINLGDFEVFYNYLTILLLGFIIYNIINIFFFRNLLKRFGIHKISKFDFYECGFRPQIQKPIQLSIQFLLICIFFLLYDIEFIFIFPYISGLIFVTWYDFILFFFFFLIFFFSLIFDYTRHALFWQY